MNLVDPTSSSLLTGCLSAESLHSLLTAFDQAELLETKIPQLQPAPKKRSAGRASSAKGASLVRS